LSQAEIQQLHSRFRDQNVGRLQITVYDAFPVGCVKRVADLGGVFQSLIHRQRTLKRPAIDVFHHEVIRPDIEQRADMRMIQRRDNPCLAFKPFRKLFFGDLDCDNSVQACVPGFPYLTHTTRTDRREDFVGTEF
jgi:hypothetical protein